MGSNSLIWEERSLSPKRMGGIRMGMLIQGFSDRSLRIIRKLEEKELKEKLKVENEKIIDSKVKI
jgi:hypothetical protein